MSIKKIKIYKCRSFIYYLKIILEKVIRTELACNN